MREHEALAFSDVAARLGWSESKLSRMETGHSSVRAGDLVRLLDLYSIGEPDRARLIALASQARQRAWWETYGDVLPDPYETFIGFEAEASSIFTYEALLAPGLLQTAEYASAVMLADGVLQDREIASQRVAVRMARQALLTREPPPELWVILDEAALRRPIGGQDVLRRQLLRLIEASERPMTTIQVLPFAVGGHPALAGSFIVLQFASESDDSLVYSEGMTGGVFRSKSEEVQGYLSRFAALRAMALDPAASHTFIAAVARGEL